LAVIVQEYLISQIKKNIHVGTKKVVRRRCLELRYKVICRHFANMAKKYGIGWSTNSTKIWHLKFDQYVINSIIGIIYL